MVMSNIIHIATDWWEIGAAIFSGILTVGATMGAVIYTNYRTQQKKLWKNLLFQIDYTLKDTFLMKY